MSNDLDVLKLRAGTVIYLPHGAEAMVLRASTNHRDGTATIHTDHGDQGVALPCTARLVWPQGR